MFPRLCTTTDDFILSRTAVSFSVEWQRQVSWSYSGRLGALGYYYSSPVAADNKIYIASEEGVVVVLDAGEKLNVLATNKLDGAILATPALVDGNIYVRTESHLYAFGK